MKAEDFVAAARNYIGTPFHHQGRLPGVGLDCAGVIICAAAESGEVIDDVPGYSHLPDGSRLRAEIEKNCDIVSLEEIAVGDIMAFVIKTNLQHMAIVSSVNPIRLIHSYAQVRRVVENDFDNAWRARLRGCYRLRGIESNG